MNYKKFSFRKHFITGIVLFIPIWITLFIIWMFIKLISNITSPFIKTLLFIFDLPETPVLIRTIGFFISVILFYLLGVAADTIFGRKILKTIETTALKIPIVNEIYLSTKKLVNFFTEYKGIQSNKVVIVEYPRQGVFSFGIATVQTEDKIGVFIPSTPNPTTGYLIFFPKQEVKFTAITVEDMLKIVVSGGIATGSKEEIEKYL
jgi:uncharacterized membrane protein